MSTWILRLSTADARLLQALARRRGPLLTRFFRGWTHLGDAPVLVGVVLLLLLAGVGAEAAGGLALAFLASQLLKRSIARPRPRLPVGLQSLVEPPDRFSFPSGHAAASLGVGLPVAVALVEAVGWGAGVAVLLGSLLVGVSRCYLGVHYPGDVVAGWVLGAGGAGVALALLGGG